MFAKTKDYNILCVYLFVSIFRFGYNSVCKEIIMAKKYVYMFDEGKANMRNLLGGKGANLAEMTRIGLPVPYGFTVTTEACNQYYEQGEKLPNGLLEQVDKALKKLETKTGKKFGDAKNPLLISVRSGARASMPGMMDTILNLGINDKVAETMAKLTGNERFAYDSYRRFIQMYADVVCGVDRGLFEKCLEKAKENAHVEKDIELSANDFKTLVKDFKNIYKKALGEEFPTNPRTQMIESIKAVFRSWENDRAKVYRRMNDIPNSWGTAVNVQMMVFGNMGETSGTGVAFTRNPATGEKALYGEYLMNAQGEDVVAGIRTPSPISHLREQNPAVYEQFVNICNKLEKHYKDMQDMEFTIENGKLYMLQTRNGKRTAKAALKIAIDLVNEGLIDHKEALLKIDPKSLDSLLHPTFVAKALKSAKPVAKGLPASPGAACGLVVFDYDSAKKYVESGKKVVLVRNETSPEDILGMKISQGVLTARGGMTSHAAVVARGMGACCVAGCNALIVDEEKRVAKIGNITIKEGDEISIDGNTGNVYLEIIETEAAKIEGDFATIMGWAKENSVLGVRANADTPQDAKRAIELGAEGIGLCRTEHMFFGEDRIQSMREMILATNLAEREKALNKLRVMQQADFYEMLLELKGRPFTVRYLDPPLHEFLPKEEADIKDLAKITGKSTDEIKDVIASLKEFNPMMGYRGCRLAIVMPELARMQTRALIDAAIKATKKGVKCDIHIMVPLVGDVKELKFVKNIITTTADELIEKSGYDIHYEVGTMIEIPRACMVADEIAQVADFYSFGTNDLTQMTYGFSRDDIGKFLPAYYENKILEIDPFVRVDENGVGKLIQHTIELTNKVKKNFSYGVCGEQGGDPKSVEFFCKAGLSYVSCSPFRVPIAILAASQASINLKKV